MASGGIASLLGAAAPDAPVLLVAEFADCETVETIREACSRSRWGYRLATEAAQVSWAVAVLRPAAVLVVDLGRGWTDEVAGLARAAAPETPIVIVGSPSPERALGLLRRGADAIVPAYLDAQDLLGRVSAVIRRAGDTAGPAIRYLDSSPLRVDLWAGTVTLDDQRIGLTATELRLLVLLMRNGQRTVATSRIVAKVWRQNVSGGGNALRISIARLRQKLGDDAKSPRWIDAVRGQGYKFVPSVVQQADRSPDPTEPRGAVSGQLVAGLATELAGRGTSSEMLEVLARSLVNTHVADGVTVQEVVDDASVTRARTEVTDGGLRIIQEEVLRVVASVGRPLRVLGTGLAATRDDEHRHGWARLRADSCTYLVRLLPVGPASLVIGLVRHENPSPEDLAHVDACLAVLSACLTLLARTPPRAG
ncbi:hypothetical protein GCM10028867_12320 [Nocardioides pacificus]